MKKINILVSGVSSSNSITFIKALRRQKEIKFKIFGTDIYEKNLSQGAYFCDGFFKVSKANQKMFIPKLLKICKENSIRVLVPIIEEEFALVSRATAEFKKCGTLVMLPDSKTILMCLNKIKLSRFLEKHEFPTPKIYLSVPERSSFPLVKKPIKGRGSKGISIVYRKEDIKQANRNDKSCFFQEFIKGQEYSVDVLSDRSGKAKAVFCRVRLEVRDGKSVKAITVRNKTVEDLAVRIADALGLKGPSCLQCIVDKDGVPYFFDVNTRIGSATILTVEAGVNIPFLAVKSLLGMKIDKLTGKFKENIIMLRYLDEIFTLVD
ncbi:MAG: ATP-grasp domain-containing protein [Candidatus Omnitrophica bacterium]|nr:ATP-grasp domain-containing protein [Candidatus Omnitrophota bacterium]